MSLLLAGLTVLVIGDSHMSTKGYLITTLHDELRQQGARVYSYGACGTPSGVWMQAVRPPCGSAFRLDDGPVITRSTEAGSTRPLPELVKEYHPDLIMVVNGDTMGGYKSDVLPKPWIRGEIRTLTNGIKGSGASCVWVGPAWGSEGGKYGKTFAGTRAISEFLADNVSPCIYITSLNMSKPGEWGTLPGDGQHYTNEGYQAWGHAIVREVVSMEILSQIKH